MAKEETSDEKRTRERVEAERLQANVDKAMAAFIKANSAEAAERAAAGTNSVRSS